MQVFLLKNSKMTYLRVFNKKWHRKNIKIGLDCTAAKRYNCINEND